MTDKQHSIVHNELVVLNQNRKQKKYRECFVSLFIYVVFVVSLVQTGPTHTNSQQLLGFVQWVLTLLVFIVYLYIIKLLNGSFHGMYTLKK